MEKEYSNLLLMLHIFFHRFNFLLYILGTDMIEEKMEYSYPFLALSSSFHL